MIAILTGGTSTEREISLRSASHAAACLRELHGVRVYDLPNDLERFLQARHDIDLAVPLIHGRGGEDGVLQGFLEQLDIPYLFSGVTAHALAIDKALTKTVVSFRGVPVQASTIIHRGESCVYSHPVAIKQIDGGSSIGITRVDSQVTLDATIQTALETAESILIEPWIEGQEFTIGVIDDDRGTQALPVVMICPKTGSFFDYRQKYEQAALAEELCPAPISESLTKRLQELAITAHQAIGAKHVSRSDFIVDHEGNPWFLEINTIPGMTETSLLPKMLEVDRSSLREQLTRWIENACKELRT